jgi:atypical dual specificity phosphatase
MEYTWLRSNKILIGQVPKNTDDMHRLRSLGVGQIVSLLEDDYGLESTWASSMRIGYKRFSIADFGAPGIEALKSILSAIDDGLASGHAVYVHCMMGLGRTGTIAACYLVKEGMKAKDAIKKVRELRPGSIQVEQQEQLVYLFEKQVKMET